MFNTLLKFWILDIHPNDEFNEKIGVRIARSRYRKKPFCRMFSCFGGEFSKDTVEAIMNVKADYIKNNFSKFISKERTFK